ncbi:MAG: hypothetical protein HKN56_04725 [Gammaproteobacteria bacterium]|nr:hypothetical protein [Gammaproteobacteria bacterium]
MLARTPVIHKTSVPALLIALALMGGCTNLGPRAIEAGRADYNTVLRDTTDQQLLVNLVRLRYRDRPYFLEVSAVTTQFAFSPQLSATAGIGSSPDDPDATLSGGAGYEERPTISYAPLQGDEFTRRLLTPISLEALVLLSHSGWSVERLLRMCVQRINSIPNAVTASGPTPDIAPDYERFHELAVLLRNLQLTDDIAIGFQQGATARLVFTDRAMASSAYRNIVEILGITPGRSQYDIVPGLRQMGPDAISIQTRSLNGILHYLSHAVAVPALHTADGLVTDTRDSGGLPFDWDDLTSGLLRIEADREPPDNAAVKVRYRDHWFYIADNDLPSKSTFSLLAQLFALQAGDGEALRPVLTIPVGD